MKDLICCFIGHRDASGMEGLIHPVIARLIEEGVTAFYSGGMGGFDKMCEQAVREQGARLVYIPYNRSCIKPYTLAYYDDIICPNENNFYSKSDIPKRNMWMVEHSHIALYHVLRSGGAAKTLDMARKRGIQVIDLNSLEATPYYWDPEGE